MAETSPLDFLKPGTQYVEKPLAMARLKECYKCPKLLFKVCQECGCFMPAKVRLAKAECPLGKWGEQE